MQASDFDDISEVETWSDGEHRWVKVPIRKPVEDPNDLLGENPEDLFDDEEDLDIEFSSFDESVWHYKKPSLSASQDPEAFVPETPMTTTRPAHIETPKKQQNQPRSRSVRRRLTFRGTPIQKRQARLRTHRLLESRSIMNSLDKLERKVSQLKSANARLAFENTDLRRDLDREQIRTKVISEQYRDMKVNYAETLEKFETFKRRTMRHGRGTCAVKTHPDVWKSGTPGRFPKEL